MKKVVNTIAVFFCLIAVTFAQSSFSEDPSKLKVGFFGGLNIPRLSGGNDNELSRDFTSRSGIAYGLTASLKLSNSVSLRVDLMYSSEGGKRNGIQALDASSFNPQAPAGTYLYAIYDNVSILNYAEIPVLLKYSMPLTTSSKFYINMGPYVGFLLNAKQKTSGSSMIYGDRAETVVLVPQAISFDATTDVTSSINHLNLGIAAGVGISKSLKSGELFLDVRGAYGLKSIQKYSKDGNSHCGNLLIDVGYAHSL
jgi:hypothetical protein